MTTRADARPPTIAVPALDGVPPELAGEPIWVLWRYERSKSRSGWGKVPYQASKRARARANDPRTWATFDDAVAALETGWGLGFMFRADDDLMGVDLDDAFASDTGEPRSWAVEILDQLDSYAEVSPSGTGIHVLVRARLGHLTGRRRGCVEMYDSGRYFTFTGRLIDPTKPTAIGARQVQVDRVHARHIVKTPLSLDPSTDPGPAGPNGGSGTTGGESHREWWMSNEELDALMDAALGDRDRRVIDSVSELDLSIRFGSDDWLDDDRVTLPPTLRRVRDDLVAGMNAHEAGALGVAVTTFRELVGRHPDLVIAHLALADGLHELDRTPEAIEHLLVATEACPDAAILHARLGLLVGESGDPLLGIHHHHRAHAIDPADADPIVLLANAYRRLGWWHAARSWTTLALDLTRARDAAGDPLRPDAREMIHANEALVLEHLGRWGAAADAWQRGFAVEEDESFRKRAMRANDMLRQRG